MQFSYDVYHWVLLYVWESIHYEFRLKQLS